MSVCKRSCAALILAALAAAPACAKHAKPAHNANALGEIRREDSVVATVEAVDPESRAVILREPQGTVFAMQVGNTVPLANLKPHDQVQVAYEETVAFRLEERAKQRDKAAMEEARTVQENTTRELPQGVQFGRRIETTVEIVEVAPRGAAATIRIPNAGVRTVVIDDVGSQKKIAGLRPGDLVAVTYTEKLAVQLERHAVLGSL